LIYIFNDTDRIPIYFRVIPGNITKKTVCEASVTEHEKTDRVAAIDNGFYSKNNIGFMVGSEISFIVVLQKNHGQIMEHYRSYTGGEQ
jgi:transposase